MNTWHTYSQGLPLHCTALTPGRGEGALLRHDCAPSPLGPLFAAGHSEGFCRLAFAPTGRDAALATAQLWWPNAAWTTEPGLAADVVRRIFAPHADDAPLPLLLRGTAFQVRVWRALLEVARGQTVSYRALAARADTPRAARAVGSAMARNPLVYVVPCHRVVRTGGDTGHYGGGAALKRRVLDWEAGRLPTLVAPDADT